MASAGSSIITIETVTDDKFLLQARRPDRVSGAALEQVLEYVMPDEIVAPSPRTDTSREAGRMHMEALRRLGIAGRARMTFELSDDLRRVAEAGVRHRHPDYDDDMVQLALVRLWLGPELFRLVQPAVEIDP